MSKAQLVITAVLLEGRTKSEVARDYGLSRYWVQQLVKRFAAEGTAAYQPRSRRSHSHPNRRTTEYATTPSTPAAASPCATTAACTTSAWAPA